MSPLGPRGGDSPRARDNGLVHRLGIALGVVALAGCGEARAPGQPATPAAPRDRSAAVGEPLERSIRRARCPADADNCAAATGSIIYKESLDPDGDGDLHLVIIGGDVTGPGFSVLDVGKDLRPARDPSLGDVVSGAGPVFPGSYGQRQIEVTELYLQRR